MKGWEEYTAPLNDVEKEVARWLIPRLRKAQGEKKAVTGLFMRRQVKKALGHTIGGARMRKIMNHIRMYGLVQCIIASSKGYWIENDPDRYTEYLESLKHRARANMALHYRLKNQFK